MDAARRRRDKTAVNRRWLANLMLALCFGSLFCSLQTQMAAQVPKSTTFQWKDARTPAESVDSIKLLERALALTETALGPEDSAVGELAYRLAQRYDDAGAYESALRLYKRSLAIKEKALGPENISVGDCLNDLGCVQQELQNYDEALRLFQRSLGITEKTYGKEHSEVAITLSCMAEVYCSKAEYSEALRVGERSLKMREKVLGEGHPDVADSLSTLAEIHRKMGNTAQALRLAKRAVDIAEKGLEPDNPVVAQCLSTLGDVQKDLRNFDEALVLHRRALVINEKISGPEHPDVFQSLISLAQIYAVTGETQRSISTLSDLFRRQRRYLARHFQTSSWTVASRVADVLRSASEIFQTLCAGAATNNAVPDGAEHSALSKAFWEEVQAAHAASEADQRVPTAELRLQYLSLQAQLKCLPGSEPDEGKRDVKRRELEAESGQVQANLAERIGLVAQRVLEQDLTLGSIASELPTQSALVDFVEYRHFDFDAKTNQWKEPRYAAYVTFSLAKNSTNVVAERVDLGEAAPIDAAVETITKRMSAGQFAAKDLTAALQRLSQLVHGPLAMHLTNVSHLIVCPDGQLSRVPFEMLSHHGRFLIEDQTISYVGSGREIARLAAAAGSGDPAYKAGIVGRVPPRGASLVMGNPDFDLDLTQAGRSRREEAPASRSEVRSARSEVEQSLLTSAATRAPSRDYRGLKFAPLPGAEAEARSVAALLGGECVLRLGAEAREAELKAVASPRVLHLATHGFFLSDQEFRRTNALPPAWGSAFTRPGPPEGGTLTDWENPLVRCGIALAGANHFSESEIANRQSEIEDGLLTGLEASLLHLQGTELVILSACDSGTGEVKIGEGVMSLRRAFRIAGAQTVLASHWPVSDQATRQLMSEFIRRWRSGEPRGQAWHEAQLSLLRSKEFSNPYFWAAFTLTGQWQ